MRHTSWDRNDRNTPVLLEEDGPQRLAVFSDDAAELDGSRWQLQVEQSRGIKAIDAESGESRLTIDGNLARAKRLLARAGEREFSFVNESGKNWIIDDENGNKVAQFTGSNRGVRRAVLEFDAEADAKPLQRDEIIALSFAARMILESRLSSSAVGIIATLLLCTVVAILAFLF